MLYWLSDGTADTEETDTRGWKKETHALQWQNNW